jgi:hypothetical protein
LLIEAARRDHEIRTRLAASGVLFDGYHPEMEALHAPGRASVGLPPMAETIPHMRASAAADGERAPVDLARRRADYEAWARRVGWRD